MKPITHYPTLIVISLVLMLSSFVYVPCTNGVNYYAKAPKEVIFIENSWKLAAEKAVLEQKLVFVDAYAVWCGPCKQLKSTTFKDPNVADFFNKNFVNVTIDMEKGEGITLADKWQIDSYPTLMFLDASGKLVLSSIGYLNPRDLMEFGKQALAKQKKSK
ncbi:thioredoxin 1 [Pedobacter sp. UYEF25]